MKKMLLIIMLPVIMLMCSFTKLTSYDDDLQYSKISEKECELNGERVNLLDFVYSISFDKGGVITGDYYSIFSNTKISNVIDINEDKLILHYDDSDTYKGYDALLIIIKDRQSKYYSFLETQKDEKAFHEFSIKRFVINTLLEFDFDNNCSSLKQSYTEEFKTSDTYHTQIGLGNSGYIAVDVCYKMYEQLTNSSLYILNTSSNFVPGSVVVANGDESYDNVKNSKGYVHVTISRAYDANESYAYPYRYGNIPYYKDYWPTTSPSSVTITSSISGGGILGYSTNEGLSIGGNIAISYSKAITTDEPRVSAQTYDKVLSYTDSHNSNPNQKENVVECQWNYKFSKDKDVSYNQESNYMFELAKDGRDLFSGDFRVMLDFEMTVDQGFWWPEKTLNDSLDLVCRPSYFKEGKKSIYSFSYGMI